MGRRLAHRRMACRQSIRQWIADGDAAGQRRFAEVPLVPGAWTTAGAGGLFPDLFVRRPGRRRRIVLTCRMHHRDRFEAAAHVAVDDSRRRCGAAASPRSSRHHEIALCAKVQQLQSRKHDSLISSHLPTALYESMRTKHLGPTWATTPPGRTTSRDRDVRRRFAPISPRRMAVARHLDRSVGGQDCDGWPNWSTTSRSESPTATGKTSPPSPRARGHTPNRGAICERLHRHRRHDAGNGHDAGSKGGSWSIGNTPSIERGSRSRELCHILFDRTRAKIIAHTSGRWAASNSVRTRSPRT